MADPIRVAFLGPEGTFTHETAQLWLRSRGTTDAVMLPQLDQRAALDAVRAGDAEVAVVAVETSLGGPINESADSRTLDGLIIDDEITRVCHYHVIGIRGAALAGITELRSNQKAVDDCAATLRRLLPEVRQVRTSSTAAGVQSVAEAGRADVAAVGTEAAAARYGLAILAENIEDDAENWTRWVVLRRA